MERRPNLTSEELVEQMAVMKAKAIKVDAYEQVSRCLSVLSKDDLPFVREALRMVDKGELTTPGAVVTFFENRMIEAGVGLIRMPDDKIISRRIDFKNGGLIRYRKKLWYIVPEEDPGISPSGLQIRWKADHVHGEESES